jgi:RNA polymerase subunit RPABC4/transcription elongation factor Spt4
MGMQNLYRITGNQFIHEKPNLCPVCQHRVEYGEWQGYCTIRQKIISAANRKRGRCKDFKSSD